MPCVDDVIVTSKQTSYKKQIPRRWNISIQNVKFKDIQGLAINTGPYPDFLEGVRILFGEKLGGRLGPQSDPGRSPVSGLRPAEAEEK